MPINASHEYFSAEKEYLKAETMDDKIYWLEELIRAAPKHKGSENLLAELKTRLKKFKEKAEKLKKKSGGKKGIRKEGFQFVLVGFPSRGKSSLLAALTNANPKITEYDFSTTHPEIGTMSYHGVKAQIVDLPSFGSENFDVGITNNADCLLLFIENLEEKDMAEKFISRSRAPRIIVFNKSDLLSTEEKRKLEAKIKSKKLEAVIISAKNKLGLENLQELMLKKMKVMRIFLKEPGKQFTSEPLVIKEGSTLKDAAEQILKGFSQKVKETRVTGPSSKFPNQKIGLSHKLKDRDVVEFHTR